MSVTLLRRWMVRRLLTRPVLPARRSTQPPFRLEILEDRSVPAVISITPNPNSISPIEGKAITVTNPGTPIGSFVVNNYIGADQSGQLSAEVLWGDGIVSGGIAAPTVVFSQNLGGGLASYNVFASHIYTTASLPGNPYTLTLRIFDNTLTSPGTTQSNSTNITVVDRALAAVVPNPTVTGTVGAPLTNVVVARFIDENPFTQPEHLRATITWANPTRSEAGIIVRDFNGIYNVIGSHTYDPSAAAAPSPITVSVVSQDPAFGITINNSATINQAAIVPSVAPVAILEGTTTIPAGTNVGTFTDEGGGQPAANYTNPGTFAVFPGAVGITPLTVTRIGSTNVYTLATAAATTLLNPARIGVTAYSVRVADNTGNFGLSTGSLTVNNAPINIISVANVNPPTEGQPVTISPLVTFNDLNLGATAGEYIARINWGDDTPDSVGTVTTLGVGQFQVSGTHTYTRRTGAAVTRRITVTITDSGNQTVSATTAPFNVLDALLSNGTGIPVVGAAGQQLNNVPIATFVDANPFAVASDYAVNINWGIGGPPASPGYVTLVGRSGMGTLFSVTGSTVFPSVAGSPYNMQVTVVDIGGQTLIVPTTATITQSSLEVSVYAQSGSAGLPIVPTNPFALFTDANGAAAPGAYTATVSWGDGTAPVTFAAGAGITLVSGNQLRFAIPGTHTYARPGLYPITVTIAGPDGRVGVGGGSTLVRPAPYPGGFVPGTNINRVEGSAIPANTVLATFTIANPSAISSGFTATIDWGDGSPRSTGTITATGTTATTASFQVTGGNTYSRPGTYTITVTVVDEFGGGGVATLTATITNAPLVNPQGIPGVGTARQPIVNISLGLFTDTNPLGSESEYSAVINWNDPQAPGANPIGLVSLVGGTPAGIQLRISGSHTYSFAGVYPVVATVTDTNGQTIVINTSVTVRAPILTGAVNPVVATEGLPTPANLPIASFSSLGSTNPAEYNVTLAWGDGTTNGTGGAGVTVVSTGSGSFNVLAPTHIYSSYGNYVVTVTISGVDGSGPLSLTNIATVLDAPLTGTDAAAKVNEGIQFVGAPLVTFVDANPGGKASEFLAMIDWGDGNSGIGSVVQPGGKGTPFQVLGTHTFNDNRVYTSTVVVTSAGGQRAIIPATITVNNVAPTAQITNSGPVLENSPVTVSLINAFDPSPVDTAAGLRYSFALTQAGLSSTYLGAGLSNTAQFTFPDGPATHTVWGRVIDKDGGFTDYTTTVTVFNVAPTATISATGSLLPGQPLTVTLANVSDPSPVDTAVGFTYSFDLGTGEFTAPSKSASVTFTPPRSGSLTIRGRVIDKDGGFSEYTVGNAAGGVVVRDQTFYAVGAGSGGAPIVRVYSPIGTLITAFFAYDPSFRGGVNVAVGDVTGDGIPDIITGTGVGGGPHVKVFDGRDFAQVATFMATNPDFRGGIRVSVGDVDGDGRMDIVTGAGVGGGPRVQVFRGTDYTQIQNFFAYDSSFRGGVHVAVGDINGDGFAEIVTGAGNEGAPHVKVFDGKTMTEVLGFFAYESTFRGGVTVAVGDLNRDGRVQIVTGPGFGGGSRLRTFDGLTGDDLLSVFAFGPDRVNGKPLRNGMQVAVTGLTSERGPVVIVGSGPDYAPLVSIRNGRTLEEFLTIMPFEETFPGGVYVG